MKRWLLGSVACIFTATTLVAAPQDPIGETANYRIDKSRSRTSGMIKTGTLKATVKRALPGNEFELALDYDFQVVLEGRQRGTRNMAVPATYFTPEFMAELRETGRYESSKFKVEHRGYRDATTMMGRRFEHCDVLHFWDIDTGTFDHIEKFMVGAVEAELTATGQAELITSEGLDNMELDVLAYDGVPVLGAVKLDLKGDYNGIEVRAGADYVD